MAHTLYPNKVLGFKIEDQLVTKLRLNPYITVDNSLVGKPGDTIEVYKYSADDDQVEELEMGQGNTKQIEASYDKESYKIKLAQVRTRWYDEENMIDPKAVQVAINHVSTDLINHMVGDIMGEFKKATRSIDTGLSFDTFVDAVSMLAKREEEPGEIRAFAFITPKIAAELRKAVKDQLQYVESYVRSGYIGTLAGVDLITTRSAFDRTLNSKKRFEYKEPKEIILATPKAVTLFNKKGTEVERDRGVNTRENWLYARKYYVAALTDDSQVVKIKVASGGSAAPASH